MREISKWYSNKIISTRYYLTANASSLWVRCKLAAHRKILLSITGTPNSKTSNKLNRKKLLCSLKSIIEAIGGLWQISKNRIAARKNVLFWKKFIWRDNGHKMIYRCNIQMICVPRMYTAILINPVKISNRDIYCYSRNRVSVILGIDMFT